jgi:TPR repeat protein
MAEVTRIHPTFAPGERAKPPWNKFWLPLVAALMFCVSADFRTWAATDVASSNHPPRLVVAVLPFENATGDAARDDWRLALPALVRSCLGAAEFTSTPGRKKTQASLVRAGWTATNAVDATLARRVAGELKANVAVWGSFRRQRNGWGVDAKVLRTDSEAAPVEIQVIAPRWVKLAEAVALRLSQCLGRPIADDDWQYLRMDVTNSEQADRCLAKAITLDIGEAPAADQEKAWRDVLAADPRCVEAHASLIYLLNEAARKIDCEKAVQDFVRRQPRSCWAHLYRAWTLRTSDDETGAEAELREALQLHRGCPRAAEDLFNLLGGSERWADLTAILKEALVRRPDAESTRVFLADALAQSGDLKGASDLLEAVEDLPEEDELVDLALLQVASAVGEMELAGRELLRLGPQAETNDLIRKTLESAGPFNVRVGGGTTNARVVRPRSFTPGELRAELDGRLTAEERQLVVNPLEITPEVTAEARRLAVGMTNGSLMAIALFAEVARRGRGSGDGGQRTASQALKDSDDPQTRLSCQEYAKLFVVLARALGLEAWLVHIERCADGSPGYHDCAALFLDGQGVLVDPTWRAFVIPHQEFTVLDDVRAISHQAMQPGPKPDPRRLRLGLKLNPDDRWTRLQYVRGMAQAGELDDAAEELRKVQYTGVGTWDVHETAARLEIARQRWKPALAALLRSLALSPSNAMVHGELTGVYRMLDEPAKSREHLEAALRLDRGEIPKEFRQQSGSQIALLTAVAQGQSGDRASREALQRRAEAGDLPAQIALAKACFDARPPREDEGQRWLLKASEQGDDLSQFNYARNLLTLRGSDAAPEIVKWLNQSADQGNGDAQHLLGLILYEGKLGARDNVTAGQWVYLAADQGHAEARHLLQEMQLFLDSGELARARKRADAFKPTKKPATTPR